MAGAIGLSVLAFAAWLCMQHKPVEGGVLFSTLPNSLTVTVGMNDFSKFSGAVEAGVDQLYVKWSVNASAGADASFKTIKTKLCYAPPSQVERGWRKTHDDLHKDKTCQFDIAAQPYNPAGNSSIWRVTKEIPGAQYFVRAYAINSTGSQVAYGQSTNKAKTSNTFTVVPISGRPTSLYIATACFSIFSVGTLATFFTIERRLAANKKAK